MVEVSLTRSLNFAAGRDPNLKISPVWMGHGINGGGHK
jgi:hypothetical protein